MTMREDPAPGPDTARIPLDNGLRRPAINGPLVPSKLPLEALASPGSQLLTGP